MSDSIIYRLDEIAKFSKGINYSLSDYTDNGSGITFITIKSILKGGGYDKTGLKTIRNRFSQQDFLAENDLLIAITDLTRDGDIVGSPIIIPKQLNGSVASMDLVKITPNKSVACARYLYYFLMLPSTRRYFVNHSSGSTVLHLETRAILKLNLLVPSLDYQERIANILSTVDEVIEKTEAAIEKYEAIKAGMMQDLFTRGIDVKTGKLRPSLQEAPELYKETELGWIPKEWEVGRFGDICNVKVGYSFKSSEFGSNGYRLIRISNIQEKTVKNLENDVFIVPEVSTQEYEVKFGDLLIALSGATTGKVGFVKRESLPALLNQRVGLFEPQENTSIDYVYQIVSDASYQKSILENCPSSAQPNVSPKYLETIPIKYAKDKREQVLIVRLLKSLDSTIENEYNQLKKSLKIKQGLLLDLLIGKVIVKI